MSVDAADFLENTLPTGVARDFARDGIKCMMQAREERNLELERKGYMVNRAPDMLSRALEGRGRGRGMYADHLRVFDLVFEDKIKIARGEARKFVQDGLVVCDEGREELIRADGIVLATRHADVDLPKRFVEKGEGGAVFRAWLSSLVMVIFTSLGRVFLPSIILVTICCYPDSTLLVSSETISFEFGLTIAVKFTQRTFV